jgi:hypothetical protein
MQLDRVIYNLPDGFDAMQVEASAEHHRLQLGFTPALRDAHTRVLRPPAGVIPRLWLSPLLP